MEGRCWRMEERREWRQERRQKRERMDCKYAEISDLCGFALPWVVTRGAGTGHSRGGRMEENRGSSRIEDGGDRTEDGRWRTMERRHERGERIREMEGKGLVTEDADSK